MSRIYPYLSATLAHSYFSCDARHFQYSPSQPRFTALCPAFALGELPLSASKYSCLLLPRVPLVSSFMAHCCHTLCSPPGRCASPNSTSNLHIRIYVVGVVDHRMSATAIHLLQEDGKGKSSKDISNY